jgi:methionine sulfoxide reductase heme-binding subunit
VPTLSAIDVSSYLGLGAVTLLAVNLLLGVLMSVKYNPVRAWPHRRIKTFQLHNWTGYLALAVSGAHAVALLFSSQEHFRVLDLLYPLGYDRQPLLNGLGALAIYLAAFVVVTSYFRVEIGRRRWKLLHYTTYAAAAVCFAHAVLTDPTLRDKPVDYLDGEKVYVEALAAGVVVAAWWRIRHRWIRHVTSVAERGGGGRSTG